MSARLVRQTLFSATLITVGGNILGRLFGYGREALIASSFGTSAVLDTFLIAFTIPEILTFVIFAALPAGVISGSTQGSPTTEQQEASLFWRGLAAFGLIIAGLTAFLLVFKGPLLDWLAPDLSVEMAPVASRLFGILALIVFFRGLEAYFRAWLFKRKHFVAPALSPLILNGIIIASLLWAPGGIDIHVLAYGWLAASAGLFLVHAVACILIIRPTGSMDGLRLGPVLRMTLSIALIEAAFLIYPAIDRYLAVRYLGDGEIAALRYALFISMLPPGMLVVTFSAAAFPWITDLAAQIEPARLREFYRESVRMVIFIMLPIVTGLVVFSANIIRVAFQRGMFDTDSVHLTASPLVWYSLGLIFYSIYFYQIRYYYARKLLSRLGLILAASLVIKLVTSAVLVGPFDHDGLALATSIAWLASCLLMTLDLARSSSLRFTPGFGRWLGRVIPALAVALLVWLGLSIAWPTEPEQSLAVNAIRLAVLGLCGLAAYYLIGLLLRIPEAARLGSTIRWKRFGRH